MKRIVALLILVALVSLPRFNVSAQAAKDTIVIRGLGNITTFNTILSQDGASLQAGNLLWPAPFDVDNTGQPVPGLTSWKVSSRSWGSTRTSR